MTSKKQKKIDNYERKNLQWYFFMPLLGIVSIIPLIVRGKYIEIEGVQALFWKGMSYYVDMYSYWKSHWLVVLCILSILMYIILRVDKRLPIKVDQEKKYYIPMVVYIVFALISTLTSNYPDIVINGFIDMYQGLFVLFSYIIITSLTINYVNNEHDVMIFAKGFMFLVIVEGILGVLQYFGADYMKSDFLLNLFMPNELEVISKDYIFGKYTIYGTMYNTNFVGSFATIIVPLSLSFLVTAKSKKSKIISAIALFLSACLWIGCNSRAGYLGILVVSVIAVIYLRKEMLKHYKFALSLVLGLIIIVVTFNTVSDGRILGQFLRLNLFKEIDSIEQVHQSSDNLNNKSIIYEDIKLSNDCFTLKTNKESLTVKYIDNTLSAYDNKFNELSLINKADGYIYIDNKNYDNYKIGLLDENNIELIAYGRRIEFYLTDQGFKIVGCGNRLTEPIVANKPKFLNKYDRFASGRGYIWSRTIMMLPSVIFKGYGPDTYPVVFPQDDFIAKLNAGMDASMIVDKPHNMYLQIAINTGLISLLALLSLWGIYLITSLKLYKGMIYDTEEKCIGFACFMAVLGYLVAGIFNDQIVSVAPLFWITLGLGISINERLKYKNKA